MRHPEKKITKIIEELTIFFLGVGATKLSSSIALEGKDVKLKFCSDYDVKYEVQIKHMEEMLKQPKNEVLEDFYWELVGTGDPGETSQLLLIGIMVDEADIKKSDNKVEILLKKVCS